MSTSRTPRADHDWLDRLNEENKEFYAALGQFMLAWSDVERSIGDVLVRYAKVSEPVGRALFSGTRARTMMSFITAIAENTGMSKARKDDLIFIFAKVATLNTSRDRIAHHGSHASHTVQPATLKRKVTNAKRSSRYTNEFVQFVGSDELKISASECLRICAALKQHLAPGQFRRYYWPERILAQKSQRFSQPKE